MDLPGIDLNLLVALHALLTERNVTRAGESIGLSQPAMSAALGRLRRHFGDELLTRDGQRFTLTPLASSLLDQSEVALHYVEHTFAARPVFDEKSSTREFTLMMSDYALTVLGGRVLELLEQRAPDVRLRIRQVDRAGVDDAAATLRSVDLMVLPFGFLEDLPSQELFRDKWVGLADPANDVPCNPITRDCLGPLRWVLTYNGPTQFTPADHHLKLAGVERHIDVVMENFLALPFLLAGTRRVGVLQERLARTLQASAGVRLLELDLGLPELVEAMWWHPSRAADPGHRWLQALLREAAATLAPPGNRIPTAGHGNHHPPPSPNATDF